MPGSGFRVFKVLVLFVLYVISGTQAPETSLIFCKGSCS